MTLFSNFCNICYNIDNGSLKDISEENMKHLNDILIMLVGHADIIKFNVIYLCQLCCEELTRFDKFREMCLCNLIQLRQRCINMKLELEDNACAVKNTIQQFVYEEVLRKGSLEKSNSPISIVTDCHEIVKSPADVNKDCLVFNRQVTDLQLETNECEFDGGCSVVSGINSVTECDESRVTVTNEMLRCSENTRLEKFEGESDEDYHVSDANNDNKSDTSQIEIMKEGYDLKNERENTDSGNFTMKNYEIESDEHANLDVKVPVVYNSGGSISTGIAFMKEELNVKQEISASKGFDLQRIEDGFGNGLNITFEINNVSTVVNMEEPVQRNIRGEDAKGRIKLQNKGSNNVDGNIGDIENNTFTGKEANEETCNRRQADVQRKGPQMCQHCDKQFPTPSLLVTHMRTHTGDRPYRCTICDKAFTQPGHLHTHARTHTNVRSYKCNVCEKTFTQNGSLTRHQRIHTNTRPYKCTQCSKTFTTSGSLTTHMRVHTGQRPYKCSVCDKAFTQSGSFNKHKRTHGNTLTKQNRRQADVQRKGPHMCQHCHKEFTTSSKLVTHMRTHTGDRPYKCTICDKAFTTNGHLHRHAHTHTNERPYKCNVCEKTFTQNGNLITHQRIHTNTRPYTCTQCSKTFTESSHLTAHMRVHTGQRPYKCSVCDKAFTQSGSLTTHKRTHGNTLTKPTR